MNANKGYYFLSIPIALLFWLILNYLFSAMYVQVIPKNLDLENMLASPVFLIMMLLAIIDMVVLWVWVIPIAKSTNQHMLAYAFPELPLVLGFVVAFSMNSVTPYYYFLPVWIISMVIVHLRINV